MRISGKPCPWCGRVKILTVSRVKYNAWRSGNLYAQQIGLNVDDTERLISGACPDCWDQYMAEDPDEAAVEEHERFLMTEGADHLYEGRGE